MLICRTLKVQGAGATFAPFENTKDCEYITPERPHAHSRPHEHCMRGVREACFPPAMTRALRPDTSPTPLCPCARCVGAAPAPYLRHSSGVYSESTNSALAAKFVLGLKTEAQV